MKGGIRPIFGALMPGVWFAMIMWTVWGIQAILETDFVNWGILPRNIHGLKGIITSPFVHLDLDHLWNNTAPIIACIAVLVLTYRKISREVFLWVYFVTGIWVWIFGREYYHVGASGVIYGLISFLFFSGLFRKDRGSLAVSLVIMFVYGGFIGSLLDFRNEISYESHILGALTGLFLAFYFRKSGVPEKETELEEEEIPEWYTEEMNRRNGYVPQQNYTLHYIYKPNQEQETPNNPPGKE